MNFPRTQATCNCHTSSGDTSRGRDPRVCRGCAQQAGRGDQQEGPSPQPQRHQTPRSRPQRRCRSSRGPAEGTLSRGCNAQPCPQEPPACSGVQGGGSTGGCGMGGGVPPGPTLMDSSRARRPPRWRPPPGRQGPLQALSILLRPALDSQGPSARAGRALPATPANHTPDG